eukprot:4434586-Alexandrium_andersonii.AAC.1
MLQVGSEWLGGRMASKGLDQAFTYLGSLPLPYSANFLGPGALPSMKRSYTVEFDGVSSLGSSGGASPSQAQPA